MFNPPHALWSIWRQFSISLRLIVLILSIVGIYFLLSAIIILKRLHSLASQSQREDRAFVQQSLAALDARCANLRQLLWAAFYLFGTLFFWGLQSASLVLDSGGLSVGMFILNNYVHYFAFATNVFLVFLVLHLVQWRVSVRLRFYARSLKG
jgi:hypothetical protein